MNPLTAQELLHVWEEGRARPTAERALLLLAGACPEQPREALMALPIGRRDALLLTLREWTFGSAVTGLTRCPACGERLELHFSVADVRVDAEPPGDGELTVAAAGYEVAFRLPDSTDLVALHGLDEPAMARHRLLQRCLLGARRNGKTRPVSRLPADTLAAVVQRMGEADPQADVHTALSCAACTHTWRARFDIVSFFWSEIESWAYGILREVHLLASAYRWREADILALSPGRRRVYLEMAYP